MDEKSRHEDDDPRPQPEYDMVFRQAVSAEDVYLGMGNKNPTTASCEELVVRAHANNNCMPTSVNFYSLNILWCCVKISILGQDTTAWHRCRRC